MWAATGDVEVDGIGPKIDVGQPQAFAKAVVAVSRCVCCKIVNVRVGVNNVGIRVRGERSADQQKGSADRGQYVVKGRHERLVSGVMVKSTIT